MDKNQSKVRASEVVKDAPGLCETAKEQPILKSEEYDMDKYDPLTLAEQAAIYPLMYRDRSAATSSADGVINCLILLRIAMQKIEEVMEYLLSHPDITCVVEYVFTACHDSIERLRTNNALSLGVYHDPEIPDDHLILYIRPGSSKEEAIDEIFAEIDCIRDKYLPQMTSKSGWFHISIDVTS